MKTDAQIEFLYYPLYEYVLKGETSLVYELIKRAFLWDHPFITYAKFSEKLSFLTLWYALPQLKKVKQQKIIKTVSKLLGSSRWVLVGCELPERSIFNLSLCIYFFFLLVRDRHKILLKVLSELEWVTWLMYPLKSTESLFWWFSGEKWRLMVCLNSFNIKGQIWQRFLKRYCCFVSIY